MMNIAIDLGNSSAKVGRFVKGQLIDHVLKPDFKALTEIVNSLKPEHIIISTVNQHVQQFKQSFSAPVLILDECTPVPFNIAYSSPQTLGKDRIAAIAGAYFSEPNVNTLVVDVGTCITYDFIDSDNNYLGGGISPGIEMKFKAMHTYTTSLPLASLNTNANLIGNTTEQSLQSGALYGTVAEIEEIVRMYKDKFPHLRFIICGGGAELVGSRLRTTVEVRPELVLSGLNGILEYNV